MASYRQLTTTEEHNEHFTVPSEGQDLPRHLNDDGADGRDGRDGPVSHFEILIYFFFSFRRLV